MIEKVISGGQSGADIGGVHTAWRFGIPTGGWMPKGFKTLDGQFPCYAEIYDMREHKSVAYPPRTYANVRDSNGTMRFAANWNSPGEKCTLKAILYYKRPYFDVDLVHLDPRSLDNATQWIVDNEVRVLNIAGNSEQTHLGTRHKVEMYMTKLFQRLGLKEYHDRT
jgi:hypothetical protein